MIYQPFIHDISTIIIYIYIYHVHFHHGYRIHWISGGPAAFATLGRERGDRGAHWGRFRQSHGEKPWKTGRCFPMVCHGNPIKNHGTTSNHGKNPVVFPWMIFRNETLWLNNKKRGFLVVSCGYSCSYHLKTTDIQSMLIQLIYSGIYQLMYINYRLYCNDLV